ncbi:hypothetical protein BBJ28_00002080 [Nothophytophthora sp. Chile5]|nr:hypothetical protein BBJ28_00002080 [Nothophytophthora sp. Chile5]
METAVLPWLVVLATVVLSLEIQQHLLLARVLGAAVMLAAWGWLLAAELQLKAVCCAVVYHGVAESVRQWQRNFPCVFEKNKDRKVVLWLLFWARVFIWGATLGGAAVAVEASSSSSSFFRPVGGEADGDATPWRIAAVLAVYCEVIEVLVMLYFADEELPYLWRKRVGHWLVALLVAFLESSGRLSAFVRGPTLAGMSPLALMGVLLLAMWLSIEIPWYQVAAAASTIPMDPVDEEAGQENYDKAEEAMMMERRRAASELETVHRNSEAVRKPELFVETRGGRDFYFRP